MSAGTTLVDGMDDAEEFKEVLKAFKLLEFKPQEVRSLSSCHAHACEMAVRTACAGRRTFVCIL